MGENSENLEKAARYIFGELENDERDSFEEAIFSDDKLAHLIDSLEKDFLDEYLRGEMDKPFLEKFEEKYLQLSARKEKLAIARVLQQKLFNQQENNLLAEPITQSSFSNFWTNIFRFFNFATAGGIAVILILALIGGWTILNYKLTDNLVKEINANISMPEISPVIQPPPLTEKDQIGNIETEENVLPQETPKIIAPPAVKKTPNIEKPKTLAFTLFPPVRSSERPILVLPKSIQFVRLRIIHNNQIEFTKYQVELKKQNGRLVIAREFPLTATNIKNPLIFSVNSAILKPGSYELTLSGLQKDRNFEEIKFYDFTVKQK